MVINRNICSHLFTFALMMTGAISRNVGKLFSELKFVTDNLLFINHDPVDCNHALNTYGEITYLYHQRFYCFDSQLYLVKYSQMIRCTWDHCGCKLLWARFLLGCLYNHSHELSKHSHCLIRLCAKSKQCDKPIRLYMYMYSKGLSEHSTVEYHYCVTTMQLGQTVVCGTSSPVAVVWMSMHNLGSQHI